MNQSQRSYAINKAKRLIREKYSSKQVSRPSVANHLNKLFKTDSKWRYSSLPDDVINESPRLAAYRAELKAWEVKDSEIQNKINNEISQAENFIMLHDSGEVLAYLEKFEKKL